MEKQIFLNGTTINGGLAVGKIFNIFINEENHSYTNRVLKKIIKKIYEIILDEENQLILTLNRFNQINQNIIISSHRVSNIYHDNEFKKTLRNKLFVERKGVPLSLKETFLEYNELKKEVYPPFFPEETIEMLLREKQLFFKRLLVRTKKDLLHHKIKHLKEYTILFLDEFEVEYLDQIPKAIKGLMANINSSPLERARYYLEAYNLPLILSDQVLENDSRTIIDTKGVGTINNLTVPHYNGCKLMYEKDYFKVGAEAPYLLKKRRINIYANIIDPRYKKEIATKGWFQQLGLINTEIFYGVKGSVMDRNEMCYRLKQLIKGLPFTEAIFQIPDFSPEKACDLNGENNYFDILMSEEFDTVFSEAIRGIAMASIKLEKTIVLVPMLRSMVDIKDWERHIKDIFIEYTEAVPEVGFVVETDSLIEQYEDILKTNKNFALLDLDDLRIELLDRQNRNISSPYEYFMNSMFFETQDFHQAYRSKKVRHGISGNLLTDKKVFGKILTQGYLNIYLSYHQIKKVSEVLTAYIEKEGKYINHVQIEEEKAAKNQKKREEHSLAIKTEMRRRTRIYKAKKKEQEEKKKEQEEKKKEKEDKKKKVN